MKTENMNNTDPTKKLGLNPGGHEVPASNRIPVVLLIQSSPVIIILIITEHVKDCDATTPISFKYSGFSLPPPRIQKIQYISN